jgi:hypothetical protein
MVRMTKSRKNKQLFAQYFSLNNKLLSRHFIFVFLFLIIGLVVSIYVYLKNQEVGLIAVLRRKIYNCGSMFGSVTTKAKTPRRYTPHLTRCDSFH